MASQNAHLEVVRLLLDRGAVADQPAKDGTTPLMMASHNGHRDVVKLLQRFGANADVVRPDGASALDAAAEGGQAKIVEDVKRRLARRKPCAAQGCGEWGHLRCTACGESWYCGKPCQLKHWKAGHKGE